MKLTTFGAIMSFTLQLEEQAVKFYTTAAQGALVEIFYAMAVTSRKRMEKMERVRREEISEMILEPIHGFEGDDYHIDLSPEAEAPSLIKQAIALEEVTSRFYKDAARKLPLREVVRAFTRMAEENSKRKSELEQLQF